MKGTTALAVIACIVWPTVTSALNKQKAQYVGGNVASIPLKAEGMLSTDAEDVVVFTPDKKRTPALRVPYGAITSLDYGQRAGQGVGVNIRLTHGAYVSKTDQHYLTMTWNDESGNKHAAVFKLGKDIIPVTLTVLEARAGTEVNFQSQEARLSAKVGGQ